MRNAVSLSTERGGNQRISTSPHVPVLNWDNSGFSPPNYGTNSSGSFRGDIGWINGFGAVTGSLVGNVFTNATDNSNLAYMAEMSSPSQTYKLNSTTPITTDYKSKISSKEASQKYSLSSVVSSKLH